MKDFNLYLHITPNGKWLLYLTCHFDLQITNAYKIEVRKGIVLHDTFNQNNVGENFLCCYKHFLKEFADALKNPVGILSIVGYSEKKEWEVHRLCQSNEVERYLKPLRESKIKFHYSYSI